MDVNVKREVEMKLSEAYRQACIAGSLLGQPSGGEPKLDKLDFDLKTISPEKQRAFIVAFVKAAVKDL